MCAAVVAAFVLSVGAAEARPHLGVRLDPQPLPKLLVKHLGLETGQGIRIQNVQVNSPADKAELERDDIIVSFDRKPVADMGQFIAAVRAAAPDGAVPMEVIHLGKRRPLNVRLEPPTDEIVWKYAPEPDIVTSWRPGKIRRLDPKAQQWIEVRPDDIPEFEIDLSDMFKERHTYHHFGDEGQFSITIEGDPTDENTRVVVRAGSTEHVTTVRDIHALPDKYQEPAKEALEKSLEASRRHHATSVPDLPGPPLSQRYFENLNVPPADASPKASNEEEQALKRLQGQMESLLERLDKLERQNHEMLQKLLEKNAGDDEKTSETPILSQSNSVKTA
jgi:membrane-associated protease RseP (regulator of RpoE activity)